jgi:hypothetical protein
MPRPDRWSARRRRSGRSSSSPPSTSNGPPARPWPSAPGPATSSWTSATPDRTPTSCSCRPPAPGSSASCATSSPKHGYWQPSSPTRPTAPTIDDLASVTQAAGRAVAGALTGGTGGGANRPLDFLQANRRLLLQSGADQRAADGQPRGEARIDLDAWARALTGDARILADLAWPLILQLLSQGLHVVVIGDASHAWTDRARAAGVVVRPAPRRLGGSALTIGRPWREATRPADTAGRWPVLRLRRRRSPPSVPVRRKDVRRARGRRRPRSIRPARPPAATPPRLDASARGGSAAAPP